MISRKVQQSQVELKVKSSLILSRQSKNQGLFLFLLCHEEDVYGEHAVSSGKPDKNKLFYMMTKGISYEEARKLMVKANFRKVINSIEDENVRGKIEEFLDNKLEKN